MPPHTDPAPGVAKIAQAHLSDVRDDVLPRAKSEHRFDLIDPVAMHEMAHVLWEGEQKYGLDNWRRIPIENHISHGIGHLYAWMAGDRSVDHLAHALCNAMFACALEQRPEYRGAAEGQEGNATAVEFDMAGDVPQEVIDRAKAIGTLHPIAPKCTHPEHATTRGRRCPGCDTYIRGDDMG